MNDSIINESQSKIIRNKKKGKTKYRCPYCSFRGTKYENVIHIEKKHPELIPEGYTAARLFFNHINKKDHGTCIVCKQDTKWNEDTWRYERLCDNPRCKQNYQKSMRKGMIDKHGKTTLLNNPNHQKKMLAARRISGEYRFKDGGVRSYVGKYEKNLLEYFDKVMHVKSKDVLTPGPNIKYEFKGKKLLWITDVYYVPANLIIEVKDGGDNPNKREMPEYRAKQIAKEKALEQSGEYNYIRLTNNNFVEFAKTLDEIKDNMDSDNETIVFNVLESMGLGAVNPAIPSGATPERQKADKLYMVNYMINDEIFNTGFTTDSTLNNIKIKDINGMYKNTNITEADTDYVTSYTEDKELINRFYELDESHNEYNPDYMYEYITNSEVMIPNQPLLDDRFTSFVDEYKSTVYSIETDFKKGYDEDITSEAITVSEYNYDYTKVKNLLEDYKDLNILCHPDGYIIYNQVTEKSSEVFHLLDDIQYEDLDRIDGGK